MKLRAIKPLFWQHKSSGSLSSELFLHEPAKARGNLALFDDFLLDTSLKGNITSTNHLTIGPNAIVRGSISARSISHQGSLEGSLSAGSRLVVQGGSKLQQTKIRCDNLEVQCGSQLIDVTITTS